jgi:uncharacterized protein
LEQADQCEQGQAFSENAVSVQDSPFAVIRARSVVKYVLFAGVLSFSCCIIFHYCLLRNQSLSLKLPIFTLIFYSFLLLFIRNMLSRAGLALRDLFGPAPQLNITLKYVSLAIPLILLGLTGRLVLYVPLSYVAPNFVETWVLDLNNIVLFTINSPATNLLNFLVIVVMTPFLEELVFRGILLTRWSLKWNTVRGIITSSIIFGIGHATDAIWASFFGYVMCIVYIRTKTLFVPVAIHMAVNGTAWFLEAASVLWTESDEPTQLTLSEFQSYWWVGLLLGAILIPWVDGYIKRNAPTNDWRRPCTKLGDKSAGVGDAPKVT